MSSDITSGEMTFGLDRLPSIWVHIVDIKKSSRCQRKQTLANSILHGKVSESWRFDAGLTKMTGYSGQQCWSPSQYPGSASSSRKRHDTALTLCAIVKVPTPPPSNNTTTFNHSGRNSLFRDFAPWILMNAYSTRVLEALNKNRSSFHVKYLLFSVS